MYSHTVNFEPLAYFLFLLFNRSSILLPPSVFFKTIFLSIELPKFESVFFVSKLCRNDFQFFFFSLLLLFQSPFLYSVLQSIKASLMPVYHHITFVFATKSHFLTDNLVNCVSLRFYNLIVMIRRVQADNWRLCIMDWLQLTMAVSTSSKIFMHVPKYVSFEYRLWKSCDFEW